MVQNSTKSLLLILTLIGISFFVFSLNLNNTLFWDDEDWIINNPFVHDFKHIKEIFTRDILAGFGLSSDYYRPLLLLTFAFNYVLSGTGPIGYHLLSNGLHIANGILIFLIFRKFIGQTASFLGSLLFLIHPLQTEAVTYISGRGDPLSVFFMLLVLLLFTNSVKHSVKHSVFNRMFNRRWYWWGYGSICIFLMILAILSRETAILLPFLLVLFYTAFLSDGKFLNSLKGGLLKTWPYFSVSAGYFLLRLTVLNFKNTLNFYSQANAYSENLAYRLYTFGAVLIEYFKLIFVPVGLHMERDLALRTSIFQWPVWLALMIVFGILYLVYRFYKEERILNTKYDSDSRLRTGTIDEKIRNTDFQIWFFSWGWFFIGLAPVSGIIPINAVMYEHWLYLPLIGFFVLIGFYLDKLFRFLKEKQRFLFVPIALPSRIHNKIWIICVLLFGAYISFYAVQSAKRNILWGKPIKFYEDILKYNPSSLRVTNNLANLYLDEGNLKRAEELYLRATESPNGNLFAQPYYNLGNIYEGRGDITKAVEYYEKAVEVDPSFPFAYQNLAIIYAGQGELKKASDILEELKKIRPDNPRIYYNLGLIYTAQGNKKLAIENLETGLQYVGRDVEAETQIKEVLSKLKNPNIKIENVKKP